MKKYDIAILGAGASGLMAALEASGSGKTIALIEGNSKIGKKLLATGNGRCNIANKNVNIENFHGDSELIKELLKSYPFEKIVSKFEEIGIFTFADTEGRLYPKSLQAAAVLKALSDSLAEKSVDLITDFKVVSVRKNTDGFIIKSENGLDFICTKLIIACGGKASPKHSGNADAYEIVRQLGHTVTKLMPALTKFNCDDKFIKNLSGVKAKCNASLLVGKETVYSENGEMIFSDKTLSGICLFNLSVHANRYFSKGEKVKINFDFMPTETEKSIHEKLIKIIKNRPLMNSGDILNGLINMKLGFAIVKKCGIDTLAPVKSLKDFQIKKLISTLKSFTFEVSEHKNWDNAQVTDGGIPLKEVNIETMQSKICPSLYFAGEILNIHGDCGGYNLYWAWVSGMIAGESSCVKVIKI